MEERYLKAQTDLKYYIVLSLFLFCGMENTSNLKKTHTDWLKPTTTSYKFFSTPPYSKYFLNTQTNIWLPLSKTKVDTNNQITSK